MTGRCESSRDFRAVSTAPSRGSGLYVHAPCPSYPAHLLLWHACLLWAAPLAYPHQQAWGLAEELEAEGDTKPSAIS